MVLSIYQKNMRRKKRVRWKLNLMSPLPRLSVFRSNRHIYAQIIDDSLSSTLVSASTLELSIKDVCANKVRRDAAKLVGECLAKRALAKGILSIKFDRGSYRYTGCIKDFADSARAAGLAF